MMSYMMPSKSLYRDIFAANSKREMDIKGLISEVNKLDDRVLETAPHLETLWHPGLLYLSD